MDETTKPPAVSICIPAYNQPELLRRCLESVEMQGFKDIEVILADDSTNNRTRDLATVFASRIPLVYEHHDRGLGSPGNWNRALDLARGKLVMVMHQDDFFATPSALEKYCAALADQDIFFVFGSIEPDERPQIVAKIPGWTAQLRQKPELLLGNNIIGPPSNVMFRNAGDRFDPDFMWVVDYEMYFRWLKAGRKFINIPEKLVTIGRHDAQITRYCDANPDIKLGENALLFRKHAGRIRMDLRLYDHYWRMVRNTASIVGPERMAHLRMEFPSFMQKQWQQQQALGISLLKNGIISKSAMFFSWVVYRLSQQRNT